MSGVSQILSVDSSSFNHTTTYSQTYSTDNIGGVIYSSGASSFFNMTLNKVTAEYFFGSPTGSFFHLDTTANIESNLSVTQSTFTGLNT